MLSYAGTQTGSSRNGTAVRLTTRQEVRGGIIACWLAPYQHRSEEVWESYARLLDKDPLTDIAADFVASREDPRMSSTSGGRMFVIAPPVGAVITIFVSWLKVMVQMPAGVGFHTPPGKPPAPSVHMLPLLPGAFVL